MVLSPRKVKVNLDEEPLSPGVVDEQLAVVDLKLELSIGTETQRFGTLVIVVVVVVLRPFLRHQLHLHLAAERKFVAASPTTHVKVRKLWDVNGQEVVVYIGVN